MVSSVSRVNNSDSVDNVHLFGERPVMLVEKVHFLLDCTGALVDGIRPSLKLKWAKRLLFLNMFS